MQIKTIEYSRVFNLGGYENKKVGVICEVGDELPEQAMEQAIKFVENYDPRNIESRKKEIDEKEYKQALLVVSEIDSYGAVEINKALDVIKQHFNDDLPF